jgi:hypothetical protein
VEWTDEGRDTIRTAELEYLPFNLAKMPNTTVFSFLIHTPILLIDDDDRYMTTLKGQ